MKHPVEQERGKKFVGLPEFAAVCERVMSELGLEQARGTVTNVPDERTIRYYLAEGLIQPVDERQGTASVFAYVHLLQLVAVKKLQAEHFPIRKIRELVAGKSEHELESLLGIGTQAKRSRDKPSRYPRAAERSREREVELRRGAGPGRARAPSARIRGWRRCRRRCRRGRTRSSLPTSRRST